MAERREVDLAGRSPVEQLLASLLVLLMTESGTPQVLLAERTGLSAKHVNRILRANAAASVETWDDLLAAAGGGPWLARLTNVVTEAIELLPPG